MQPGADEVDYRETADISLVHGAIKREHNEPVSGMVPVPLWLIGLSLLVVFGGGVYLGMFSGGFSENVFNERDGLSAAEGGAAAANGAAGSTAAAAPVESLHDAGKKVFTQNCVTCHQPTGLGIAGAFPPLVKSEWVLGSPKRVTMILLKGLQGPVHVIGTTYNGAMPAWSSVLSDKKIAGVLSYIRSEWGNTAPEITPEQVAAERKELATRAEPWAEADLLAVPADAAIDGAAPAKK